MGTCFGSRRNQNSDETAYVCRLPNFKRNVLVKTRTNKEPNFQSTNLPEKYDDGDYKADEDTGNFTITSHDHTTLETHEYQFRSLTDDTSVSIRDEIKDEEFEAGWKLAEKLHSKKNDKQKVNEKSASRKFSAQYAKLKKYTDSGKVESYKIGDYPSAVTDEEFEAGWKVAKSLFRKKN